MLLRVARRALSTSLTPPVPRQRAAVRVPATSANMGPGYDCLGIALGEYNTLIVEHSDAFELSIEGEGEEGLPRDKSNYYYRAFEIGYKASAPAGAAVPDVAMHCVNAIPPARGMGSSSACLVAGISAGFALNGYDVSDGATRMRVYQLCAEQEGHPDNVAPAVYGGLQLSFRPGPALPWLAQRVPVLGDVSAVLFIPDFELPTKEARALLADEIPRTDAVFNISRAAMLVHAFGQGRLELLRYGAEDALHQPQRGTLFPLLPLIKGALQGGAHGAWLSGAGPTVCAVVGGQGEGHGADAVSRYAAEEVAESMRAVAAAEGVPGRVVITPIVEDGVCLAEDDDDDLESELHGMYDTPPRK